MKKSFILPIGCTFYILFSASFFQKNQKRIFNEAKWTGTITYNHTSKFKGQDNSSEVKSEWDLFYEHLVNADFMNSIGVVTRSEVTREFRKTIAPLTKSDNNVEETIRNESCSGKDRLEVSVEIDQETKKYFISFFTPSCAGQKTGSYKSTVLAMTGQPAVLSRDSILNEGSQITIPGQDLKNPDILSGIFTDQNASPNGAILSTVIKWNLKKSK